jgi:hypothetical protein
LKDGRASLPAHFYLILIWFAGKLRVMEPLALPLDSMTLEQKLMAMETLWDNLCRDETQIPVPDWHKQILDERERQIENGEARFVDWETAKARIRDRIS